MLGELGDYVGGSVADTLFKNGPAGAQMVQKALNEYLPADKKIDVSPAIGSKSYEALQNISNDSAKTKSFLETLAWIRLNEEENGKNERERIYHHLNNFLLRNR